VDWRFVRRSSRGEATEEINVRATMPAISGVAVVEKGVIEGIKTWAR